MPRKKDTWMSEEARPADRSENLTDPYGNEHYFDDDPDLSNAGDSDIINLKRHLYLQKADLSAYTHPGASSRNLFLLDRPIIDYPPEVIARRPDWIACPDLSSNRETVKFLFPGWKGPFNNIDFECHGSPFYNIAATLFDVEGHILGRYQLESFHILNLLRLALCTYEKEVFIHPTCMTDNIDAPHEVLHGRILRSKPQSLRWWVFLCYRFDTHWALAIHDQAAEMTFYLDSGKESDRQSHEDFLRTRIRPIVVDTMAYQEERTWSSRIVPATAQAGSWECGLWVVEYTRIFFQEFWGRLLAGCPEIKLNMTRCYWGDTLQVARK
ncbi:hypothetical protein C8A01DRAFT_41817, partial [Parachaetomium inaequale]